MGELVKKLRAAITGNFGGNRLPALSKCPDRLWRALESLVLRLAKRPLLFNGSHDRAVRQIIDLRDHLDFALPEVFDYIGSVMTRCHVRPENGVLAIAQRLDESIQTRQALLLVHITAFGFNFAFGFGARPSISQ